MLKDWTFTFLARIRWKAAPIGIWSILQDFFTLLAVAHLILIPLVEKVEGVVWTPINDLIRRLRMMITIFYLIRMVRFSIFSEGEIDIKVKAFGHLFCADSVFDVSLPYIWHVYWSWREEINFIFDLRLVWFVLLTVYELHGILGSSQLAELVVVRENTIDMKVPLVWQHIYRSGIKISRLPHLNQRHPLEVHTSFLLLIITDVIFVYAQLLLRKVVTVEAIIFYGLLIVIIIVIIIIILFWRWFPRMQMNTMVIWHITIIVQRNYFIFTVVFCIFFKILEENSQKQIKQDEISLDVEGHKE